MDEGAIAEGYRGGFETDGLVEDEECFFKFVLVEE